jgi:hypothetical protein
MKVGWVLGVVGLLAVGIASIVTPHREAPARQTPPRAATEASRLPVALPERQMPRKANADLFDRRDWTPRAPRAPAQAAQEPALVPSAPPNPYRLAGTMQYDGSLKAVFIREQHVHVARPGETLDGGYKVLAVTRDAVTLRYTPLDIDQHIALASDPAAETAAVQAQVASQPSGAASAAFALGSPLAVR